MHAAIGDFSGDFSGNFLDFVRFQCRMRKTETRMQKTHVAIALDNSGSMDHIRRQAVIAYNAMLKKIRSMEDKENDVRVSFWTFNGGTVRKYFNRAASSVEDLTLDGYIPSGSTNLYGTVNTMIDELRKMPDEPECAFLLLIVTDGEDTCDYGTGLSQMKSKIASVSSTGRWTIGFQVPDNYVAGFSSRSGVSRDNIFGWSSDSKGIAAATQANEQAIERYAVARKSGATSVSSLYVTANLKDVSKEEIKKKLVELKNHRIHTADRDTTTKVFYEYLMNKDYVTGAVYYQLIKKEKIQPHKQVLIVEKGTKSVYGGKEARQMIGLSTTDTATVIPGNLSDYDVFVQSKAPNRKIPRGTKVIINREKDTPDDPTWEQTT